MMEFTSLNWDGLSRIIRSAARSQAMLDFSQEKTEKHFIAEISSLPLPECVLTGEHAVRLMLFDEVAGNFVNCEHQLSDASEACGACFR